MTAATRRKRADAAIAKATKGEGFALYRYRHHEDAVGFIDGVEPVVFVYDPKRREGMCMSVADARKLVSAFTHLLLSPLAPWNGGAP